MKLKLAFFITLALLSNFALGASSDILKPHSLKKLDVAGTEMVLIQLFVKREHVVKSLDDHLGVSQNERQVSLYIDHHQASAALKEALAKKGYIRDINQLKKLIKESFAVSSNEGQVTIKLIP